jgi:Amt family ammonium transporter
VVGIHLVGGLIGTLYVGVFGMGIGLVDTGSFSQLWVQAAGAVSIAAYSFVFAYAIGFAIEKTVGFRVRTEDEAAGVDSLVHGEVGYALAG